MNKNIDYSQLIENTARKRKIYSFFSGNREFFDQPVRTAIAPTYGNSPTSLTFKGGCLSRIFDIKCEQFCDLFAEAVSGLEGERIYRMHSSALLPLLLFHAVSEDNPIFIEINGRTHRFTHVEFEHLNEIKKKDGGSEKMTDSHIDICLFDGETELYIESKFSEYFSMGSAAITRTPRYDEVFSSLCKRDSLRLKYTETNDKKAQLESTGLKRYCNGVKQLVCHYMGAHDVCMENPGTNGILCEMVFDFGGKVTGAKEALDSYRELYDLVSPAVRDIVGPLTNLELNEHILTYQDVFKPEANKGYLESLSDYVKRYYRLI